MGQFDRSCTRSISSTHRQEKSGQLPKKEHYSGIVQTESGTGIIGLYPTPALPQKKVTTSAADDRLTLYIKKPVPEGTGLCPSPHNKPDAKLPQVETCQRLDYAVFVVVSPITSLRWYDPDQVQRVRNLMRSRLSPDNSDSPSNVNNCGMCTAVPYSIHCSPHWAVHYRLAQASQKYNPFSSRHAGSGQHEAHLRGCFLQHRCIFVQSFLGQAANGT